MAIIVSDKIYIGFQERLEGREWNTPKQECKEVLLGFATYYEDNAAFKKRKDTIDSWAAGRYWQKRDKKIPAKTIDNELLGGFQISRDVRRTASWGGGNVVWRIEDPRGFELEISSANMAAIMDCSTIIKGEIQGKCKWGWNTTGGSKVVLLPENSEPYQQAIEDTRRHNSTVSIKDVKIGDTVELKNGTVATYLGYHHFLRTEWGSGEYDRYDYQRNLHQLAKSKKKNHFFRLQGNHRILMVPSPKLVGVVTSAKNELTLEQGAERINKALRNYYKVDTLTRDEEPIIFVSPKPIKDDEYRTIIRPVEAITAQEIIDTIEERSAPTITRYSNLLLSFNSGGSDWLITGISHDHTVYVEQVYREKLVAGQRETKMVEVPPNINDKFRWGYSREPRMDPIRKQYESDLVLRNATVAEVLIEYNNEQYPTRY